MTDGAHLERLLLDYEISPDSACAHKFRVYFDLLQKWNRRVNLVSSTSWSIVGPLIEESLWASRFYPKHPLLHLDIGSGAGFPALPMRIVNGNMRLDMIESRSKRAAFLETAVDSLGLAETKVFNCTLEDHLRDGGIMKRWGCVSWKAIRLKHESLSFLVKGAEAGAQFWLFHGIDLPIEGGKPDPLLSLIRKEDLPHKPSWHLSIFEKTLSDSCAPEP